MMDREKRNELPKMQVGFIDSICLPVYKVNLNLKNRFIVIKHMFSMQMLAEAETGLAPLYNGCKTNRDNWEKLQQQQDKMSTNQLRKIHVSPVFRLESLWSDNGSQV